MRIAVLGGSFNPPHLGHQLIADQVLTFTDCNEVWLTPCFKHTFAKKLAPAQRRSNMTKMLVNKKIKYCGEEIENRLSGETLELMKLLQDKYRQHQFSFVIGSDNLKSLKKWGQWQKLITDFQFLIFPRPGSTTDLTKNGLADKRYKLKFIQHPQLVTSNISSTMIRKRIKAGLTITHLVPKKIEEYINQHSLYR